MRNVLPKLFLLCLFPLPVLTSADQIEALVTGVHDGDTLIALTSNKREYKVRLAGIDAPELGQPFGRASKEWLARQVFATKATITWDRAYRNERLLAVVKREGKDINRASVEAGHSWWFAEYAPNDRNLREAQIRSQQQRNGLWGDSFNVDVLLRQSLSYSRLKGPCSLLYRFSSGTHVCPTATAPCAVNNTAPKKGSRLLPARPTISSHYTKFSYKLQGLHAMTRFAQDSLINPPATKAASGDL